MQPITILGAGRIGSFMATELGKQYPVQVLDQDSAALSTLTHPVYEADATEIESLKPLIRTSRLVISAVPGSIGFAVLKNIIQLGKPVVDISFFPEDPFQLQQLALDNQTTAIIDSGIAPGFSNLVAGYYDERMAPETFSCLVGGLPIKRTLPWQYKASFSPDDVLEEYTRTVRIKENGSIVEKPPLSDYQLIDTDILGTLEAFNTDGLRTLLHTVDIPNLKEQTLRYPGHWNKLKLLRKSGFFKTEPIDIQGCSVSPRQVTSQLLKDAWKLKPDEQDCTYMRITLKNNTTRRRIELYDQYDQTRKQTSMARCTGFTCLGLAQLFLKGEITSKGVIPPEKLGRISKHYKFVLKYLEDRGIQITDRTVEY